MDARSPGTEISIPATERPEGGFATLHFAANGRKLARRRNGKTYDETEDF